MAAGYLCDAGDNLPGAYLITDLVTGDTAAWCSAHFADLCAAVTRAAESEIATPPETITPQDVDNPGDDEPRAFSDATVERAVTDGPLPSEAQLEHDELHVHPELAHRERTKRKLAARPDSAKTSAETIPDPGESRR